MRPSANGNRGAIGVRLRQLRTQARALSRASGQGGGHLAGISERARALSHERLGRDPAQAGAVLPDQHSGFLRSRGSQQPAGSPDERKVLEAGPGVRMELLAWGNTVMEPHLFRIAPQSGSGESYTTRARNSCTSCRENCRFRWKERSTSCNRATVSISRAPRRIAGKTRAATKPGCCGSTRRPPSRRGGDGECKTGRDRGPGRQVRLEAG